MNSEKSGSEASVKRSLRPAEETRVLILAPTGRDAQNTSDFLDQAGLQPKVCRDMFDLCFHVANGCGAMLLAEEALGNTSVSALLDTLSRQPSWSDIPIAIITSGGETGQIRLRRLNVFGPSGNVMLLERPFRPGTLISALAVALRSRERQYQVRDLLAEKEKTAETLEQTVAERTTALRETIAELEAFSYSITHDMRGPLRSIASYSQFLTSDYADKLDETGKRFLQRVHNAAVRLDRLIQDVLNYSRLSRGDLVIESVDLDTLVRNIITEYPNLQVHQQEISIDSPLLAVRANSSAVTQCVSNLLNNAVKFVRPGEKPNVRIYSTRENGFVRLSVQDQGIGIEKQYQAQIFGAFSRLHDDKVYEGTGIGLAIVKRAANRMNGNVGVESEAGKGSTFWIELPPE